MSKLEPEPRIVNLPSPETVWAMAVRERDHGKCIVCESEDETAVRLLEDQKVTDRDGRLDLDSGATLCARCSIKYDKNEKFRAQVPDYLKPHKKMRLNVEIDRDLHAKFAAVCRFRGTSISRAVREFINQQMTEVEDGTQN